MVVSNEHSLSDVPLQVLVIAYYFPPMGLSGVQRITKFVKYLPTYGWNVTVLTVQPKGYYAYDDSLQKELDQEGINIIRVPSNDPNRFFKDTQTVSMPNEQTRKRWSKLSNFVLIPDSKIGWKKNAIEAGKKLLENQHFDVILSTAPPFTAHLIGTELSEFSGIPLVLDFRETWVDNSRQTYPLKYHRNKHLKLEGKVVSQASKIVTINRSIKEDIIKRHLGHEGFQSVHIVPHGFDPEDFEEEIVPINDKFRWVYSGVFYDVQVPDFFLKGMAKFLEKHPEAKQHTELVFAGLTPNNMPELIEQLHLDNQVQLLGYFEHHEAVKEIRTAAILWLTLGKAKGAERISTSKLYEYFGTKKPILGLLPKGEEASNLSAYQACKIVEPDDVNAIADAITVYYKLWKTNDLPKPDDSFVEKYNRKRLTGELAKIMSELLSDE